MKRTAWGPLLLMALLMLAGSEAWARVGWAEKVKGNVQLEVIGQPVRPLQVGDDIEEKYRLRTGADGEVVIHFIDEALLVIRPNSQIDINSYRFQAGDRSSSSAVQLLKGGLRFVSGLIGKLNREEVKIYTPMSTIGIRGTDFDTVFLEVPRDDADAGLYTCVSEGGTVLTGENGESIEVAQGQTAFTTNADFVARGLSKAREWGLIRPPPGLFQSGTFDGQIEELKREGLNRLQGKLTEKIPSQFQGLVPADALGSLFAKKKSAPKPPNPCAA